MRSLLFLCLCTNIYAQKLSFDVTPREIGINEKIQFSITIEGNQGSGRTPSFQPRMETGEFELLSRGPNRSQSTSIVNGRISSQTTYTYSLRPTKKGKLIFPAQTLVYAGKTYKSSALTIEVGEQNYGVRQTTRDLLNPFRRHRPQPQNRDLEVFGTVELSKQKYYLGEPIELDVYIYATPGLYIVARESSISLPDFKEFWMEDIPLEPQDPKYVRKNSKRYQRYTVYRKRLFANKTGILTIPSADFNLVVTQSRPSLFSSGQQVQRRSEEVEIEIKPLPEKGRPRNFSGLVGTFEMVCELDKEQLKVGETASLKIMLKGNGNFSAIRDMELDGLDSSFEIFKGGLPTTEVRNGITKSKTWALALVPKREGSFPIPWPAVSYFDLKSKSYKIASGSTFKLEVLPGQGLGGGAMISNNGGERSLLVEENLSFIKLGDLDHQQSEPSLPHPLNLLRLAGAFLLMDLILFLILYTKQKASSRRVGMRPAYAYKYFKKGLNSMRTMAHTDDFYARLSELIFAYFGDKLEREGKGISLDMIRDHFEHIGIESSYNQKLAEIIESCDLARFTPSTTESRENLLTKAHDAIAEIEGALK